MALNTSQELANRDARIAELEARLAEANETLQAIRTGQVDALVVSGLDGDQIFALEGADHTYRVLVEEMQEGTVTLDKDGLILYANRQFASMMRTPAETIVGSRFHRFLAPERQSRFSELLADGETQRKQSTFLLLAADGTAVPVQVSLNRLETGGIQTICALVTDLTGQRNYEAMVKDGELSRLILDQAVEAIVVIDAQGKILRASDSAQKLAGRTVILQPFDTVFHFLGPEQRIETSYLLAAAHAGGGLHSVEVELLRPGRPSAAMLMSMGPLWSGVRDLLGCVITLTDITDRKQSEEALARQAHALELSNGDLKQFAYAVSHDLREPIRTLSVYAQLFENKYKGHLDQQADDFIRHTVQAAHRLEALMDGLLVYTQTAENPQAVDSLVDANAVLFKTIRLLETSVAETGAEIASDPLPMLQVEEVHLQQLFQNLISNSLKYRTDAPPRIHVSALSDKGMWRLSIADNGIGIDPQYHKQIFGLFKRLHGNAKYAGSGIGLAICHKIVERYGGRMWVDSAMGKGCTFFLTLPAGQS